jgi:hypothetical protein
MADGRDQLAGRQKFLDHSHRLRRLEACRG